MAARSTMADDFVVECGLAAVVVRPVVEREHLRGQRLATGAPGELGSAPESRRMAWHIPREG